MLAEHCPTQQDCSATRTHSQTSSVSLVFYFKFKIRFEAGLSELARKWQKKILNQKIRKSSWSTLAFIKSFSQREKRSCGTSGSSPKDSERILVLSVPCSTGFENIELDGATRDWTQIKRNPPHSALIHNETKELFPQKSATLPVTPSTILCWGSESTWFPDEAYGASSSCCTSFSPLAPSPSSYFLKIGSVRRVYPPPLLLCIPVW